MAIAARPSTIDRAKFDLDLSAGESWEDAFLGLIGNSKVECKLDRKAKETGNVFIEYEYRGRPSGLAVTEAEWWAIGIEGTKGDVETAILASVPWLKERCRELFRTPRNKPGGDDGLARGIIVRLSDFVEHQ
jgi:hypothetical protein